ncbi:MAG: T9SS type A sorting domain-containing protein [Bacteroidia bacterium]|nr:T9SS type A sorting domain-containing protein [Bacteroidia bacterium]
MKQIFTLLTLILFAGVIQVSAQCAPDTTIDSSGLYPNEFLLPCIETGQLYDTVIQIKNFDTVQIGGADLAILWVRVDSLKGLPTGIDWSCVTASADPNCKINQFENACIRMSGTTNDPKGQYKMGIFLTANTSPLGMFQGVTADFFGFRYDLQVIGPGEVCPVPDTTILKDVPFGYAAFATGINTLNNDLENMMIYPSPIRLEENGFVSITSSKHHKVKGSIVDISGKEVFSEEFDLVKGTTIRKFNARDLSAGTYFYNITNELGTSSVKFIKLK